PGSPSGFARIAEAQLEGVRWIGGIDAEVGGRDVRGKTHVHYWRRRVCGVDSGGEVDPAIPQTQTRCRTAIVDHVTHAGGVVVIVVSEVDAVAERRVRTIEKPAGIPAADAHVLVVACA